MDKKTQLLDASERVYCEFGNLGLTVRRLAAEGDTTSQTIYTYFGSRDAVIVSMYDRILADLRDRMLAGVRSELDASAADPASRLVSALTGYYRYSVDNPARFKMLAEGTGPEGTEPGLVRSLQQELVDTVAAGMRAADHDPSGVRQALAQIHGLIQAELDGFIESGALSDGDRQNLVARTLSLVPSGAGA
ncbi:MAG: TetR/AcrR family transcriptional regulator [Acidimicrobiales bacterium]